MMKRVLGVVAILAAMAAFTPQRADAALSYPLTGQISLVQNGGPTITALADGNNLWDTNLTWTNNGPAALANVYFINDMAWLNSSTVKAQWDNATQHWISGSYSGTASNPSLFVTLDPSVTNIGIPSGFGLAAGDGVPAFLVSAFLAPGASVTTDVNFELSPNITLFFFSGAIVGTPQGVPEPFSLALLGGGLVGLAALRRRRTVGGM